MRPLVSLFQRLDLRTVLQATPRGRRRRVMSLIEPLEERVMLFANLVGNAFSVADSFPFGFTPGESVSVTYRVLNNGDFESFNGFSMSFYLSQDEYISDFSDVFLGTGRFNFSLYSGYTTIDQYFFGSLPDASHPIWTGSGTYSIGMTIDIYGEVYEYNEFDNSNFGNGWDRSQIYVTVPGPDLQNGSLALSIFGEVEPGALISATVSPQNVGATTAASYQVGYYLSRDPYWDAADALIKIETHTNLAPFQTYYAGSFLTLPGLGNSVYQSGQTQYYVLSVLDPNNLILESNEFNNFNRGVGIDAAAITITEASPTFDDLPPTNVAPGGILKGYLDAVTLLYARLEKDYTKAARKASGVIDFDPLIGRIHAVRESLLKLKAELAAIGTTGMVSLGGSAGGIWNSQTVEYLERVLVDVYRPGASSSARVAAREDNLVDSVVKQIRKDFLNQSPSGYFKAAAGLAVVAGVAAIAGAPAMVVAAVGIAAVGAGSIGVMLQQGLLSVQSNDRQRLQQQNEINNRQNMEVAPDKPVSASQQISSNTELGGALQDLAQTTNSLTDRWNHQDYDDVDAKFDELFDAISGKGGNNPPDPDPDPGDDDLTGRYDGTYFFRIGLSNGGELTDQAAMSLKVRPGFAGQVEGSIKAPFLTYDPQTLEVKSRGRIKGEFNAQVVGNQLMGNVTYRTPSGTISSTLTWTIEPDGTLRGKPSDNSESNSFFELRPV